MNNYVFFLYLQRSSGGEIRDTGQQITGSSRILIASGAACFYRKHVRRGDNSTFDEFEGPLHTPTFKHEFPIDGLQKSEYTGSISLELIPAVSPPMLAGGEDKPCSNGGETGFSELGFVQQPIYWTGGSEVKPFQILDQYVY